MDVPPVDLDKIYAFFTNDQIGYGFLARIVSQVRFWLKLLRIIVFTQLVFNIVGSLGGHLIWQVIKPWLFIAMNK